MIEFIGIVYLLLATTLVGILSFISKIIAEKNFETNLITIYLYFIVFILSIIFFLINGNFSFENINILNLGLILLISLGFVFFTKIKFIALKNLSPSIFFVNLRIFTSIFILFISNILFNETLTKNQEIGFIIGILIFFLLFDKKDKPRKNSNLKLGLVILFISILIFSYTNPLGKLVILKIEIYTFLIIYSFFSFILSLLLFFKSSKNKIFKFKENSQIIKYSILMGLPFYFSYVFLLKTFTLIPLIIAYKIFSFEIFIPIILSFIFYKEKITYRKIIALILTGVSFWFFLF
jgi:drug/metabolite transporter (DMT)-like permease